jgi:3'-5' exoribonuclease
MSENKVEVDFKVINSDRRTTKNGDPYYTLELLDANGDKHEARIWSDVIAGKAEFHLPQEGQYWGHVKSRDNVFRGQKQMVVDEYWIYKPDDIPEAVKAQFAEQPVIDVDRVIDRMFHWPFWEPDMKDLMANVEENLREDGVWDKLKAIPAGASYHHSVRGGFLLHIDEMLNFSESLCDAAVFGHSIIDPGRDPSKDIFHVNGLKHYPGLIDYQILRAAIVLHDIGKVYDYDEKTLQFSSNPISDCLEHTLVGVLFVDRCRKINSPEMTDRGLRLMHAIAAHHGSEMGAVKPKTPEAILLHHIDMISASLDVCRRAYEAAKKNGTSSEYSKMLGTRPFVTGFPPQEQSVYVRKEVPTGESALGFEPKGDSLEKLPWED